MDSVGKPVILVIDDDTVILNTVVSTLAPDYSVRPFTSGESALAFLSGCQADLILLDCQMPGISGFDVLRELLSSPRHKNTPVVFITGATDGESEARALEMGAVDYLHKPVRPRSLLTRVRLQLELRSHRNDLEAMVEEKTVSLNAAYNKLRMREDVTLGLLARVTDLRDGDTGNHIERTTELVRILVDDLVEVPMPGYEISRLQGDDIIKSAKLHDLGKIGTPDNILLKPARLTREEFEVLKEHTVRGERLLADFIIHTEDPFLKTAREIVRSHHERWDGRGYPQGLSGAAIPLAARIVAIADVFDALCSPRPYKEAYEPEAAAEMIRGESGKHFDPYLVRTFERHLRDVLRIGMAAAAAVVA